MSKSSDQKALNDRHTDRTHFFQQLIQEHIRMMQVFALGSGSKSRFGKNKEVNWNLKVKNAT